MVVGKRAPFWLTYFNYVNGMKMSNETVNWKYLMAKWSMKNYVIPQYNYWIKRFWLQWSDFTSRWSQIHLLRHHIRYRSSGKITVSGLLLVSCENCGSLPSTLRFRPDCSRRLKKINTLIQALNELNCNEIFCLHPYVHSLIKQSSVALLCLVTDKSSGYDLLYLPIDPVYL